jgi:four helix bundle protein
MGKISKFTELEAWKEGHKLVLQIYDIVRRFPSKEQFVLSSQILRAAISITSNIAEGFGRFNRKEKIQFYYMGQASLVELQNQLIIAKDVGYITLEIFSTLWNQSIFVHKLITGLIKSIKGK